LKDRLEEAETSITAASKKKSYKAFLEDNPAIKRLGKVAFE
jgi:hypothetical protein